MCFTEHYFFFKYNKNSPFVNHLCHSITSVLNALMYPRTPISFIHIYRFSLLSPPKSAIHYGFFSSFLMHFIHLNFKTFPPFPSFCLNLHHSEHQAQSSLHFPGRMDGVLQRSVWSHHCFHFWLRTHFKTLHVRAILAHCCRPPSLKVNSWAAPTNSIHIQPLRLWLMKYVWC